MAEEFSSKIQQLASEITSKDKVSNRNSDEKFEQEFVSLNQKYEVIATRIEEVHSKVMKQEDQVSKEQEDNEGRDNLMLQHN